MERESPGEFRLLLVIIFVIFAICVVSEKAMPEPARAVRLSIVRQHSGNDCVSGQISLAGQIQGYTLERPFAGNIPLISSIPAGNYKGFVRTRTKDRWRIELIVPGRENIQLHVGNFLQDGVGCILIGSNLTKDLCALVDSRAAWDKFKLTFNGEAAKLGQSDLNTYVELVISDQN
jgi:hypothetical protein